MFGDVNYLAVGVATIAHFAVGAIWFGAVFGKAWQAQMNWSEEKTEAMRKKMPMTMGLSLVASLLVSYAAARILTLVGTATVTDAVLLALMCALGFGMIKAIQDVAYEGDSWTLFGIHLGYFCVGFIVVFLVLYYWPA